MTSINAVGFVCSPCNLKSRNLKVVQLHQQHSGRCAAGTIKAINLGPKLKVFKQHESKEQREAPEQVSMDELRRLARLLNKTVGTEGDIVVAGSQHVQPPLDTRKGADAAESEPNPKLRAFFDKLRAQQKGKELAKVEDVTQLSPTIGSARKEETPKTPVTGAECRIILQKFFEDLRIRNNARKEGSSQLASELNPELHG